MSSPPLIQTLREDPRQLARAVALGLFAVALIVTAWLGDDCLISLRMVANAVSGHGLVWNPGERVQAFTHPLWVLLLLPLVTVTRELYYTTLGTNLLLSGAAVALLATRTAGSPLGGAVATLGLLCSKSFLDYSTSGLENPLTHLLLAAALTVLLLEPASERKVLRLSVLMGLGVTTRHDNLLMFAPLLGAALLETRTRGALMRAGAGALPIGLWTLFSLWYYGFPFPNTAYAKLGTGIPAMEKVAQGLYYLGWTALHDPATLALAGAGITLTVLRRDRAAYAPVLGMGLHLLYVVWIGGDFMGGRFLSGVALVGAVLLGRASELPDRRTAGLAGSLALLALGAWLLGPSSDENSATSKKGPVNWHGITDERGYYDERLGLLQGLHKSFARAALGTAPRWQEDTAIERVEVDVSIGLSGLFAKPGTWYLDPVALADPLLARLPMLDRGGWRPGHFLRAIPDGYPETLLSGDNRLEDPKLAELYDHLIVVVRGDLNAPGRLSEIIAFNLGTYAELVDAERYRHPPVVELDASILRDREGQNLYLGRFAALGAVVHLGEKARGGAVLLGLSARHRYKVQFQLGNDRLGKAVAIEDADPEDGGVAIRRVEVPEEARGGFDTLVLRPELEGSDQQFRLTYVEVDRRGARAAEEGEDEAGQGAAGAEAQSGDADARKAERARKRKEERAAREAERKAQKKKGRDKKGQEQPPTEDE